MDLRHDENDEEAGLKQPVKVVVPDRWAGYSETHPGVQLLDILQESTTILRKHDGVLLTLAFLVAIPVSSLLLSHILLRIPFLEHTVIFLQARLGRQLRYRELAETVLSRMLDVPLFSALLQGSVSYVVASTYARKKVRFTEALDVLQTSLLTRTFLWTCALYFAIAATLALVGNFVLGSVFGPVVGVALAAGMVLANVTCSLAYVVSVQEGLSGWHALAQSVGLLKWRLEVALLLFLVTSVNATFLDILFEFHVLWNDNAAVVYDKYWEAPLLVCMHSFVYLFDAIMVSVFYFICKASTPTELELQHLSAANELLADVVRSPSQSRGSPLRVLSRSLSALRQNIVS